MYRTCVGELGMMPRAFERLTPIEVQWRVNGAQNKENRETERLAMLAVWLINADPWRAKGKPVRVNDLIKIRPHKQR
jgi:hypothetical protein